MPDRVKVPSIERMQERWALRTQQWAEEQAFQGQLTERLPSPLWVFAPDVRKVSRYSRHSAQIRLSKSHLRHLGVQLGEYVRVIARKDGTLSLRKVSARELRQLQIRAKLTILPGRKSKQAAS
jgi:hypothetical protein